MYQFNLKKVKRTLLPIVSASILLLMYGCEGGMVGTGTGPSTNKEIYELRNLPDRVSPDIPRTNEKAEEPGSPRPEKANSTKLNGSTARNFWDLGSGMSVGWLQINIQLNRVKRIRRAVQNNATLIDLAFEAILAECVEQLVDCKIPSDTLRVTLTQEVVNRFIKQHNEWAESVSEADEEYESRLKDLIQKRFTSLLGTEVVLGETTYSRLNGAPYDHSIRTHFKRQQIDERSAHYGDEAFAAPWYDEEVFAQWREDGTVANFVLAFPGQDQASDNYFYQNGAPGEWVIASSANDDPENYIYDDNEFAGTFTKVIGNDPVNAEILIEVVDSNFSASVRPILVNPDNGTSQTLEPSDFLEQSLDLDDFPTTKQQHYNYLQGRMDNDGGFTAINSRIQDLGSLERIIVSDISANYQESFDGVGTLLAGERCFWAVNHSEYSCEDNSFETYGPEANLVTDSPHYFAPEQFDSLVSLQDAITWQVEGLPLDIQYFGVVSADQTTKLSERELLCRGIQYKGEGEQVFCTATDEQLDNTVVVNLQEGKADSVIPEASLVQIP